MKSNGKNEDDNRSTIGGPAHGKGNPANKYTAKLAATEELVVSMPYDVNKPHEYGKDSVSPEKGQTVEPPHPSVTGSTLTETIPSEKTGRGDLQLGINPGNESLDRVRSDSSGRVLTTNQGVPIGDNQNSLKAGLRGPALLEDFILREKLTHFDHERIPERVVHARGSAAHGYFECYKSLEQYTRASLFAEAGKRTPVFVRFSVVFAERGGADAVRDARGFATKFYTDEGNWDLVGNNIPVFFIQDSMKFPDLVHAIKPEPHTGFPQASTAHDTSWDFISLMPESIHMVLWTMSDRAIPRSYRMMQGFGVHTFRLVTTDGASQFVKFHWSPLAGTHSLTWDEAVKINGADPDFHRRDLWEAIESGAFPEYELGMQIFTEAQAEKFSFDVLDATKLVPEELVPVMPVGKMVLNRNPDNFFAETEQVAFCAAHVVPGMDFSNDPLLAGRIHSYVDTQLLRLGGPNFHEIPINSPVAQVHNNQRDGFHRQSINRGRVSYEPNSLAGGCPFQAGTAGFTSFPQPVEGDKVRGKPERFADHYTQAKLFWNSQTQLEKDHIVNAFRFELGRVQTPAIRERMVSILVNVADDLAQSVAQGLGMNGLPAAQPKALDQPAIPEVERSPALSLFARPGDGSIQTRRIAIMVADGVDGVAVNALRDGLTEEGAVPRFIAARLGTVQSMEGSSIEVDVTFEVMPGVLFDALAIPDGSEDMKDLAGMGEVVEAIREQYRHGKPILALGTGIDLIKNAGVKIALPSGNPDPGVLTFPEYSDDVLPQFIEAIAAHRHFERETDPPRV
ncbi:MAG TPA: catalase [Nitrosospira sp.]|nr:catalase [Nitrosospira sp.]